MDSLRPARSRRDLLLIKALTCTMFFTFAMTTDAVGSIIPTLLAEFDLSLRAASAFHYVPMIAIAVGALALGFLADRVGRKATIVLGLAIYGLSSLLFAFGSGFGFFVVLLGAAGIGVSVFKIGALALIGDVSRSTREHTTFMNTVEGFFAVGAIVGPAIVATLLAAGLSWKYLYVIAAVDLRGARRRGGHGALPGHGAAESGGASFAAYAAQDARRARARLFDSDHAVRRRRGRGLRLDADVSAGLHGVGAVARDVCADDLLRAARRRPLSRRLVSRASCRGAPCSSRLARRFSPASRAACYGGPDHAVYLLPLSGLFMSVLYPTLNSKGISCFPRSEHGAVAGVILFFTAFAAAVGPLAMGAVSDALGDIKYGFVLATGFAGLLFAGLLINRVFDPAGARLASRDDSDYAAAH